MVGAICLGIVWGWLGALRVDRSAAWGAWFGAGVALAEVVAAWHLGPTGLIACGVAIGVGFVGQNLVYRLLIS